MMFSRDKEYPMIALPSFLFFPLLIVFFISAAALVYFVLLQEPKQGGLSTSMGGGGGSELLNARGQTGGLVRLTLYTGGTFLFVAFLLSTVKL
jgi:preprotein translocase subunit SecG